VSRPARWGAIRPLANHPYQGEPQGPHTPLKAFKDVVLGVTPAPRSRRPRRPGQEGAGPQDHHRPQDHNDAEDTTARKAPARKTTGAEDPRPARKATPARKTA